MAYKLPLYIALPGKHIRKCLNEVLIIKAMPAFKKEIWDPPYCTIIGGAMYWLIISNMVLVGTIALATWLRVYLTLSFDFGRFDYKIWIMAILIPCGFYIPMWDSFGADGFWCYTSQENYTIPLILMGVNLLVLSSSSYFYIGLLGKIKSIELSKMGENRSAKVAQKIIAYLFIFLCQWIPALVYFIPSAFGYHETWTYYIIVFSLPLGGILNGIQYMVNEGWYDKVNRISELPNRGGSPTIIGNYDSSKQTSHQSPPSIYTLDERKVRPSGDEYDPEMTYNDDDDFENIDLEEIMEIAKASLKISIKK
ncbi:hypothetical protein G9A89_005394 [Geosiphon pyriformis]|nr:hypothetical protein G9A89_005394 [Geosiphon pyriformis]